MSMPARNRGNAAIFFLSEGYSTGERRLLGRHAAGDGFLEAWLRHARASHIHGFAPEGKEAGAFLGRVKAAGRQGVLTPFHSPARLRDVGALYYPGPNLARLAWSRRRFDQRGWSLVGVTHTTATDRVMESFGSLLAAPAQRWDAVICTSTAVKAMVKRILDTHSAYMREALGARQAEFPGQLPIIPLGVDTSALDPASNAAIEARPELRNRFGIGPDDVAVLWMGRLNHHAKANPWPMYTALEAAAQGSSRRVHLVEAGWFENDQTRDTFAQAFAAAAPSVTRHVVDGREPALRRTIWFACDIFCSFSDNIQETFGLTPIEAMAAGLPVLVSDWDGYRDTVRHGIDGLRIPTFAPPAGSGEDLAMLYEAEAVTYEQYCGLAAASTVVDIRAAANHLLALVNDADLRARMGAAGRRRAVEVYDWQHVVRDYEALFAHLRELRESSPERARRRAGEPSSPLHDDPFKLFEGYGSRTLTAADVLQPTPDADARFKVLRHVRVLAGAGPRVVELAGVILNLADGRPTPASEIVAKLAGKAATHEIVRAALWLAKTGLAQLDRIGDGDRREAAAAPSTISAQARLPD